MTRQPRFRRTLDVLVIGAGQAGLAMGRELERAGRDFLILDAAPTLGHTWRTRWDSLRCFTPAEFSALRGIPFPGDPAHHPGKDDVADYLAAYARAFSLPVGLDEAVRDVRREGEGRFAVTTDHARYRARAVVVATGPWQRPRIPPFAATLHHRVLQLHTHDYRNPSALPPGPVVVVGGGNSGVQIAAELSATHPVTLAVGAPQTRLPLRVMGRSLFHWLDRTGAMRIPARSFIGRRWRARDVLIGESPRSIARSLGVRLTRRAVAATGVGIRTVDGESVQAATIVWATGFRRRYDWLHVPSALAADGEPVHACGVSAAPGLYFLGLPWLHSRGSALLGWVAADAEHLATHIERHLRGA